MITSSYYSLNDPYLTNKEKADIEALYQLPLHVFDYSFLALLVFSDLAVLKVYLYSFLIGLPLFLLVRAFPNRLFIELGYILSGCLPLLIANLRTWLLIAFSVYSFVNGEVLAGWVSALVSFGLLALFNPFLILWSLSSSSMHPKYLIAKKVFGKTFPFEKTPSTT
jgi:hypothetical protein